jgi:hypothetical protein
VSNRQQSQSALMSLLGGPCSDVLTGLDLTDTRAPPLGNATCSAPDRPEDPLDEAAEPIAEQPAAYRISCRDHPPCLSPKPEPGPRRGVHGELLFELLRDVAWYYRAISLRQEKIEEEAR